MLSLPLKSRHPVKCFASLTTGRFQTSEGSGNNTCAKEQARNLLYGNKHTMMYSHIHTCVFVCEPNTLMCLETAYIVWQYSGIYLYYTDTYCSVIDVNLCDMHTHRDMTYG